MPTIYEHKMKKFISVFTAFTTILWLAGSLVVFTPVAKAVTFADGDIVRESNSFDVYIIKLVGAEKFKRLILNPDVFNMYGHLKWSNVQVVAAGTLSAYVTSEIVRAQGDDKVYKLYPDGDTGTKKWVESLDCFNSQGFDWDSVYVINTFDRDSYTTASTNLCGGAAAEGAITLSLASDTPGAITIPKSAYGVTFMKVKIEGSGTISQVTVKRDGAGATADFANVYLYDGDNRITAGRTISSSTSKVTFINLSIAAPTTISVVADVAGTGGNQNYFTIESSSDLTANATIGGTFPISGKPMSLSGTDAGTLTIEKSGTGTRNVTIGNREVEISQFKVSADGSEGLNFKRIQLLNGGDVTNTEVTNLKLKDNLGKVVSTATAIKSTGYITFVLSPAYYIKKGGNQIFRVYADIGAVRPERTIKLYMEMATDILAEGTTYGYGLTPDYLLYDNTVADGTDSIIVTCKGGDLTLSKLGPNATSIGTATDDTVFLEYSMIALTDITIKKTRLIFCFDDSGDGYDALTTTLGAGGDIEDIKVRDKNTGTVLLGPRDGSDFDAAVATALCPGSVNGVYEDFTDTFDISAGETKTLQLTADVKVANTDLASQTTLTTTDKIKFILYSYATLVGVSGDVSVMLYTGTTDAVDDSAIAPSGNMAGEEMTLAASSLSIALAATPAGSSAGADAKTYIVGQTGVQAVGIVFTAGTASDIDVSAINLTAYTQERDGAAAGYAVAAKWGAGIDANYAKDSVAKVYLYDSVTSALVPGSTGKGFSGTYNELVEYTGLSWKILAGESRTLLVKVDISSASPASASFADTFLAFDIEATTDVSATDKDGNSVTLATAAKNGGSATDASVAPGTDFGIAQRGSIAAAKASDTPDRKILTMGSTNNEVSKIKLTGTNEGWKIEKFSVLLYDGATPDLEDRDNFTGVKIKYQTEAQYGTSDWTISPSQTFSNLASRAYSFTGDARPYVPKDDDSYLTILVDVKDYLGGTGGKSKVPCRFAWTDGSSSSFVAYGAQSGYYLTDLTQPTATDYALHFISRSRPVFAKKSWSGAETELARFTITAEGGKSIFDNTDWAETTGVAADTPDDAYFSGTNRPASAYLEFEVIASAGDVTEASTASTSFYLYDWNENIIASVPYAYVGYPSLTDATRDNFGAVTTIGFHFEELAADLVVPAGETKEFHVDIGGEDLTDFDNTDEYIYLKLNADTGEDIATVSNRGLLWFVFDDDTSEEGISIQGDPEERFSMPQDVKNIGSFPLIFRTLRGNVTP